MTIGSRISLILVVTMGLSGVGFVGAVLAQNPHSAAPAASQLKTPSPQQGAGGCSADMMETMRADQKKLDDLVADMNAAAPADKLARATAVITELVAQHKQMVDHMSSMQGGMMNMMMTGDHKMPDTGQKTPETEHEQHHPQR